MYRAQFTKQAKKDIRQLTPKLRTKFQNILNNKILIDPYSAKPLVGSLKGCYSVRLTYQDRIVYSIHDDELIVLILRSKTHYGE